jgi:hypothetical protein
MRTHQEIDARSLALAKAIVAKIDADATRSGLEKARSVCARWRSTHNEPVIAQWQEILTGSWKKIREVLLDESERGQWLRQSSPFCGILTAKERWEIHGRFRAHDPKTA